LAAKFSAGTARNIEIGFMPLSFFKNFNLSEMFKDKRLDISERFEILREAVSGTMSNFHLVREIKTGKTYGLKLLDKEKTEGFEGRFKGLKKPSEGEIGLALKHPRIVETYEFGETRTGQPYILMEFVEGTGMHTLINSRDAAVEKHRLSLLRQMAEAIEAVHQAGFIHRDVCPRNFIVLPGGETLKLIDFGLTLPAKKEFMQPGNRTGTPLYMAPEIVRRRATDQRVDICALGVTGYLLCTFEHPWKVVDTTGRAALQHDTTAPTPILDMSPKLNKTLAQVIMQCLSSDPNKRPESAEAVLKALRAVKSVFEA
jgi:serine/threonine-protein kinase